MKSKLTYKQQKVVDYDIIYEGVDEPLEFRVCKRIEKGWQPYYGPFLYSDDITAQAMVKYEEEDE
jgi:hypothetical protein